MKTSELSGAALDWAVTKCEGYDHKVTSSEWGMWGWATDWAQGGPLIEREGIDVHRVNAEMWSAKLWANNSGMAKNPAQWFKHNIQTDGPTPLIAAMRCYVASQLGDTIDIPNELTGETA
jgi:hypothetical protein